MAASKTLTSTKSTTMLKLLVSLLILVCYRLAGHLQFSGLNEELTAVQPVGRYGQNVFHCVRG